ncbi:MAG: zinc-binding dehydrogenase [Streptomyces sp.]
MHSHGVRSLEPAARRCRISWAVGSAGKLPQAKEFGFDEVVLREDVASGGEFDVVIDVVGGPARRVSLECLAPLGRLVVMGNASNADDVRLSANELWFTNKTVSGFNLAAFAAAHPQETWRALRHAVAAVADGDLYVQHVQVETAASADVAKVQRRIESGRASGKVAFDIAAVRSSPRTRGGTSPVRGRAGRRAEPRLLTCLRRAARLTEGSSAFLTADWIPDPCGARPGPRLCSADPPREPVDRACWH